MNVSSTSTKGSESTAKSNEQLNRLSIIASEASYIENLNFLNSTENQYSETNQNINGKTRTKNEVLNKNKPNLKQNHLTVNTNNNSSKNIHHFDRTLNSKTHSNTSSNAKLNSNYYEVVPNKVINQQQKAQLSSRLASATKQREQLGKEKTNNLNNTNNTASVLTPRKQPLTRQNTGLSSNYESPLNYRRNSNLTTHSNQQQQQIIEQKVIQKPKYLERRGTSLQRQNALLPASSNVQNSAFINQNLKQIFHMPRQDSRSKVLQSSSNHQNTNDSVSIRPRTGSNARQIYTSKNSIVNKNRVNQANTVKSSVNDLNYTSNTQMEHGANDFFLIDKGNDMDEMENVHLETGLTELTMMRIIKWLEDIERCTNMVKPPSQLAWSNGARFDRHSDSQQANDRGFDNEYNLSDYDSNDDQIIEYNRVVDKTFHIIHDD